MKSATTDSRTAYPQPPFPRPSGDQSSPTEIKPRPDHGEDTYRGSGRLVGMRTLITGGDSGIGRAVAIAFAREGADVAIAFHDAQADADETVRFIEEAGRRALAIQGDLAVRRTVAPSSPGSSRSSGASTYSSTTQPRRSRASASMTSRPTSGSGPCERMLTAPFWLCREAAPHMEPGASIINVASIQASKPSGPLLAYATTKGGLVTFSKALAELLSGKGIRVNVVAPGPVWTPLVATPTTDPEELTTFGGDTLLGRPAQPAELAGAFVFLASSAASYVTGEVIAVAGGGDLWLRWRRSSADRRLLPLGRRSRRRPSVRDLPPSPSMSPISSRPTEIDGVRPVSRRCTWPVTWGPRSQRKAGTGNPGRVSACGTCDWNCLPLSIASPRESGRRSESRTTHDGSSIGHAAESWRAVCARAGSTGSSCRRWRSLMISSGGTRSCSLTGLQN